MCELTHEEMVAIVDEAHRHGARVAVHAGNQEAVQRCIDTGVDTVEHGTFMTMEQAEAMAEKGIAWIPTILPYAELYKNTQQAPPSPKQRESLRFYAATMEMYHEHFLEYSKSGVLIGAGTDLVLPSGKGDPDVARELQYMVECGFNSLQAIQAGTANGAKILGLEKVTGQIAPGLEADLLIVDGDPTLHIEDLHNVRCVFLGGKTVYEKSEKDCSYVH